MTTTISDAPRAGIAPPSKMHDAIVVTAIYVASIFGALFLSAFLVAVTGG